MKLERALLAAVLGIIGGCVAVPEDSADPDQPRAARSAPVVVAKPAADLPEPAPPAPPPPDIPSIEPDIRGATTIRQQLDKHRNIASCASCHVHIDPPGFALENFDPIGGWREFYRATTRTPTASARGGRR